MDVCKALPAVRARRHVHALREGHLVARYAGPAGPDIARHVIQRTLNPRVFNSYGTRAPVS